MSAWSFGPFGGVLPWWWAIMTRLVFITIRTSLRVISNSLDQLSPIDFAKRPVPRCPTRRDSRAGTGDYLTTDVRSLVRTCRVLGSKE